MQQVCARASNVLEAQRRDAAAGHRGRQRRAPPADSYEDEARQAGCAGTRRAPKDNLQYCSYSQNTVILRVYYPLALATAGF